MHDGSIGNLDAVIAFYVRGANPNPNLDDQIRPLTLSPVERDALIAFLKALNGSAYAAR
jgi:cytochrome c peroxidase